jgi:hypothetical protein
MPRSIREAYSKGAALGPLIDNPWCGIGCYQIVGGVTRLFPMSGAISAGDARAQATGATRGASVVGAGWSRS